MLGRVFKSTGSWYKVVNEIGESIDCRIRGKFRLKKIKTTNPITVGDLVQYEPDPDNDGTGIITNVDDRTNYVIRKSVHKTGHGHLLASNIDQAILLATLFHPRTSLGFIDRFLVSTEAFRIPTAVVFNKFDLLNARQIEFQEEIIDIYESIGNPCKVISAKEGKGIRNIMTFLEGKTTLIAGHSGTGKSTFVNTIIPNSNQKVNEVSAFVGKGVHTTTFAEMFPFNESSFIIDTPGIKELGLIDIDENELSDYFPEMRELLGQCKFHNCTHTHEPQCAILDAVENGDIAPSRFDSYLSMMEDHDNRR